MAWIESHQNLATHPKLLAMARELKIDRATAIGMLHLFWWWALDAAPDGDISGINPVDIATIMGWVPADIVVTNNVRTRPERDQKLTKTRTELAKTLHECLMNCGWIDTNEGRTFIHDWQDYAGKLVAKRDSNKERQKEHREKIKSQLRNNDVGVTSHLRHGATEQNRTEPNSTITTTAAKEKLEENVQLKKEEFIQPIKKDADFSAVVVCYEQNIGLLTPAVAETLKDIVAEYPAGWFSLAVKEACNAGVRKMNYISKILERWKMEGLPTERSPDNQPRQSAPVAIPGLTIEDFGK